MHRDRTTSTCACTVPGCSVAQFGLGLGLLQSHWLHSQAQGSKVLQNTDRRMDKQLAQGKQWPGHGLVWALKPGQQEAGAWLQGRGLTWGKGRQGLQWGQGSAVYIRRKGTGGREEGWACGWERQLLAVWLLAICEEGLPSILQPDP